MMNYLIAREMDFVFFFYGASFIMLGAVCFALLRHMEDRRGGLPWIWLGFFGFFHGTNEWLDMTALSLGDSPGFQMLRFLFIFVSFLCVVEFARQGSEVVFGKRVSRVVFVFLLMGASLGVLHGWPGFYATVRYFLCFPGVFFSALVLYFYKSPEGYIGNKVSAISLKISAIALLLYSFCAGLVVSKASFFPASVINADVFLEVTRWPIQFFRGIFAFIAALGIIVFSGWENMRPLFREDRGLQRRFHAYVFLVIVGFLVFFTVARHVVTYHGERALRDERENRDLKAKLFVQVVQMVIDQQRGIEALACNPQVVGAVEKNPIPAEDLTQINERIDRYRGAIGSDVVYAMDRAGTVFASSNRNDPKSFVGKNYSFRPYFRRAVAGDPFVYFGKGVTSGERGVYVAYPICSSEALRKEDAKGVLVAKGKLDKLSDYFTSYPFAFLVSPEGIIFISSKPEWVFRSIRDLSGREKEAVRESQQFGQGPWDSVGFKEIDPSQNTLRFFDKTYAYAMQEVPSLEGWKVLFVDTRSQVAIVRLVLILIFMGFFLLAMITILFIFRISLDSLQIAASEAIYEVLVEGMPDGVELYDDKERCLAVNKAGLEMMGCEKKDVLGKAFSSMWPPAYQGTVSEALVAARVGRPCSFEASLTGVRDRFIVKKVQLLPILDSRNNMKYFIAHTRDVTEERRAQERLLQTSKMSTIGAMATGVAHEFNNVLEIILGRAELAHASGDNESMKQALRIIIDSTRRASWIVKTMLDFSSPSSQKKEYVDIVELVKQLLLFLNKLIETNDVAVETCFEDVPRVYCNPGQMSQALMNIIVNAKDAMRGLPERRLTIEVKGDIAASVVRIVCRDTGTGISSDVRERIFGPFVTTKGILGGGEERQPGMGLGLFVSYGIIKQHGGAITFESVEGKGTTFIITLPIFPKEGPHI
jgi:two-component system sensor histidine kinase DctS